MLSFNVAEKFVSINGEGRKAGQLAVFIRFQGCNLDCSYCDTKWANTDDCPVTAMTDTEILEYVKSTGVRNITLTGGEPLNKPYIDELIKLLFENGFAVEAETNGSVSISLYSGKEYRPSFTLDYKLASSGMESAMNMGNYEYLEKGDTVKFVCGNRNDLERALEVISEYRLTEKCAVYLSPVFGKIEPAYMVEFMQQHKMNGVNLQLQMHKIIWDPDRRGV